MCISLSLSIYIYIYIYIIIHLGIRVRLISEAPKPCYDRQPSLRAETPLAAANCSQLWQHIVIVACSKS